MSITITETDNTLFGTKTADTDNIVYVVGTAICGPSEPTLITTYNEWIQTFGDHGVDDGGLTWDYVSNIILAGFSVLFQRVTQSNTNSANPTELTTKASLILKNSTDATETVKFEEKYGGTFGNDLSITIEQEFESVYMRIYYKQNKLRETYKLASLSGINNLLETGDNINTSEGIEGDTTVPAEYTSAVKKLVLEGLRNVESNLINIYILNEEKYEFDTFNLSPLTGGVDTTYENVMTELKISDYDSSIFEIVQDKYLYDLKFITSGGFIDTDLIIAKNMTALAEARQDCIAILDMPQNTPKSSANTYFAMINSSYATAFAPWCYTELNTNKKQARWMPPSYIFLSRLARSIVTNGNPIWYPVAGVKRASVSNVVKTEYTISGSMIDEWQEINSQALNPILKLRSYGYVIYGQRTLYATDDSNYPSPSALRQLSVRLVANEIKRAIFNISIGLKFEKNDRLTWDEFRTTLEPLLYAMKYDRGITDYQILMDENTTTQEDIQEFRIRGMVKISVLNSAEDFDIGFYLEPSSVTFDEDDAY